MIYSIKKNHLRLVSDFPKIESDCGKNSYIKKEVCNYSFGTENIFLFVRESDILRGGDFFEILKNRRVKNLFDIRISPRFDFFASNRAMAFKLLDGLGINYTDVFGMMGVDSYSSKESVPERWSLFVASFLIKHDQAPGISLFIFDNNQILNRSQYILPSVMMNMTNGRETNVEVFAAGESSLIAM
jgi:hypothetical protein